MKLIKERTFATLLSERGVQIVDWGLAKVLARGGTADEMRAREVRSELPVLETVRSSEGSDSGTDSVLGSVMGTPACMPPEQASGRVDRQDERFDVFAVSAILCEILTGAPPCPGEREKTIIQAAKAELEVALVHSRKALECNPGNARAAAQALQLEILNGDLDAALVQLEDSVRYSRTQSNLYNDLAWFLATTPPETFGGERLPARYAGEGVRPAELALKVGSNDANVNNTLSITRLRAGDAQGALEAAEQAMKISDGGQPHDWHALSLAHQALGDADQGRQWFELADASYRAQGFDGAGLELIHAEAARGLGVGEESKDE